MRIQVSRLPDLRKIVTGTVTSAVPAKAGTGQASPAVHASDPGRDVAWVARALRSLAGVFVVTWSFRLSGYLTFMPWLAIPVAILGLTGLLVIVAAWLPGSVLDNRRQHQIGWVALVAVIMALALWSYIQVFVTPDYGTDEIAFDQYAAQLAWHGIDPYLRSMAPSFPLFHVSPNGYTFRLNGLPVNHAVVSRVVVRGLSAPARARRDDPGGGMDQCRGLGAWRRYPLRRAAAEPGSPGRGGSQRRHLRRLRGRRGDRRTVRPVAHRRRREMGSLRLGPGPAAWRGPICMGLAMAVKQTPWFVAVFVVTGIVLEVRDRGTRLALRAGLRYACIAVTSFLLPNLPYLIDSPGDGYTES